MLQQCNFVVTSRADQQNFRTKKKKVTTELRNMTRFWNKTYLLLYKLLNKSKMIMRRRMMMVWCWWWCDMMIKLLNCRATQVFFQIVMIWCARKLIIFIRAIIQNMWIQNHNNQTYSLLRLHCKNKLY